MSYEAVLPVLARLRPVGEVAKRLGTRTEIELPRLPVLVAGARMLATARGLTATAEIRADGVCVRFSP